MNKSQAKFHGPAQMWRIDSMGWSLFWATEWRAELRSCRDKTKPAKNRKILTAHRPFGVPLPNHTSFPSSPLPLVLREQWVLCLQPLSLSLSRVRLWHSTLDLPVWWKAPVTAGWALLCGVKISSFVSFSFLLFCYEVWWRATEVGLSKFLGVRWFSSRRFVGLVESYIC